MVQKGDRKNINEVEDLIFLEIIISIPLLGSINIECACGIDRFELERDEDPKLSNNLWPGPFLFYFLKYGSLIATTLNFCCNLDSKSTFISHSYIKYAMYLYHTITHSHIMLT